MAVHVGGPGAPRSSVRARGRRPQRAASAAVVLVVPGFERFVDGLGRRFFTRSIVRRFPNGELHTEVPERVEGCRCVVVGSISPPAGNLERLTLLSHTLRRAGAARVTALLPYLAYARQDRAAARSESLGLAWVGELLRGSGVDEIVCVDAHSEQAADVLGLRVTSLSPAELIADALPEARRVEVTFVAPDEGAVDRCAAVARAAGVDRPVVWARKRRTPAGVEHLGLVGSPTSSALIVDDILDTGETLVSCCEVLRREGVRNIGVVATHGLFTGERWRALLSGLVGEIWITNTVLSPRRPRQTRIVSVAPLFATLLEGSSDPRRL